MAVRAPSERQARRKEQTRARLVEAAREVVAARGAESATIADITAAADLGFGTFYRYFESKEAALAAVVDDAVEQVGAALDELTAGMADAAEVVATSIRHVLTAAVADATWGWFVLRAGGVEPVLARRLGGRLVRDLRRGVERGRFEASAAASAPYVIAGALQAVLRARLEGSLDASQDRALAAGMLRYLGLDAADADDVASRPLAPLGATAT